MEFDNELTYNIPFNNSKESDKRNYFSQSTKTLRDEYYCKSDDYEYGYGDTRWK
jgi:hypothetical protein